MPAEVGSTAPPFSLKDQDGNDVALPLAERNTLCVHPFLSPHLRGGTGEIRDHLGEFSKSGVQVG